MKMKTIISIVALFAAVAGLRADTSYLLIQGPFGMSGSEVTFKWKVNYDAGVLLTGQQLLNAVFGTPAASGTYTDGFAGVYDLYRAGNPTLGAGYIDFDTTPGSLGLPFLVSLTLGGITVEQDPSYSPGFNYYVAGGGGGQVYPNMGAWTFSIDGSAARTLSNGSFDAWVFGSTFPSAMVNGAGNTPAVPNFSGATEITAVPEPAGVLLVLFGAGGLFALPRRRRR
ncbi:MAG: PEP-CTERM sorting domain-containing protein [Chthoniobacteraceae bacterium]